jgi:hypothetical protein
MILKHLDIQKVNVNVANSNDDNKSGTVHSEIRNSRLILPQIDVRVIVSAKRSCLV